MTCCREFISYAPRLVACYYDIVQGFLPYRLPMVVYLATIAVMGYGELGSGYGVECTHDKRCIVDVMSLQARHYRLMPIYVHHQTHGQM